MWAVPKIMDDWPDLASLEPEEELLFYDSPKLFTVRDRKQRLLLAYECAEDQSIRRYLVVPISPTQLVDLTQGRLSVRNALINQGWTWLVDINRDGEISSQGLIEPATLPVDALPRPEAYL